MKTIFHRIAFVYVAVFLISFLMIMIGVRSALEFYFTQNEVEKVVDRMPSVEKFISESMDDEVDFTLLAMELQLIEEYSGTDIYIITEENEMLLLDESDLTHKIECPSLEKLKSIIEGEVYTTTIAEENSFQNEAIMIGYPIVIKDNNYAMIFTVPLPTITKLTNDVSTIILVSMLISAIIVIILIFFMTKRVQLEIKIISDAAKYISEVNFEKKIKITRHDELGELAESFNHMATELEKTENIRRRFISSLSHDMRTPLTTISGYTRGMIDGTIEPDKFDRYLGIVLSESERLIKLSNDLLDLSKMETGEISLKKVEFDINELLINVIDNFEQKILSKDIKLRIDFSKEKVLAYGDADALQRVVYNLIDNATKFVNEGGTISIRSELKIDKYYIGISNTGKVLSSKELEMIWDRFTKLDTSRSLDKTSSGLGLSIVKEIIRAHGEEIEVYSNDDIGVAFIFTLSTQMFN